MRKDKLNIQALVELTILIGFSYLIYDLLKTGSVLYYIHPKMVKYLLFALIVLILMALIKLQRIFTYGGDIRIRPHYLIFIVPLMMALVLEHQSISTSSANIRGVSLDSIGISKGVTNTSNETYTANYYKVDNRIILKAENYMTQLSEILHNVEKFHGAEVELEGFIYREPHLFDGQFIISRTILSCCVADAENIGLLSYWEAEERLKDKTWVKAIGILQSSEYENPQTGRRGVVPLLVILELEVIPEPTNPYIYP